MSYTETRNGLHRTDSEFNFLNTLSEPGTISIDTSQLIMGTRGASDDRTMGSMLALYAQQGVQFINTEN